MFLIKNITKSTEYECDAIETLTLVNNKYTPIEAEYADGFNAMKIIHVSPTKEKYEIETFVFEGHTMKGTEDVGEFEIVEDELIDEEILPEEENK